MKGFLLDTNFDSIKYLEIGEMQNAGDYFSYIFTEEMEQTIKTAR